MAQDMQSQLISWLNDALAMEEALVQVMTNQLDDAKGHPQVYQLIEGHIQQTKQQADLVRNRIQQLGGSPSGAKTAMGKVQGWLQGVGTGMAEDKLVKNAISDYAAEHFEIASYSSIIEAAKAIGDNETARICEQIRSEEEVMADKIRTSLPMIVNSYLSGKQMKRAA